MSRPRNHRGNKGRPTAALAALSLEEPSPYDGDQLEWLTAVDRWRTAHDGRTPGPREIIQIAVSLGYRRVPAAATDPTPPQGARP